MRLDFLLVNKYYYVRLIKWGNSVEKLPLKTGLSEYGCTICITYVWDVLHDN